MAGALGVRAERCCLVWAGGNAWLEEVMPGLSSEEVRLVEKGEATTRAGMNGREGVCRQEYPAARPRGPGKAVPAPQSRAGEGRQGPESKRALVCPSPPACFL